VFASEPGLRPRVGSEFKYTYYRERSIAEEQKRRRGRPATGNDPVLSVRIPAELHAAVATWIDAQPDPKPSRSEAVRRLLEKALGY